MKSSDFRPSDGENLGRLETPSYLDLEYEKSKNNISGSVTDVGNTTDVVSGLDL